MARFLPPIPEWLDHKPAKAPVWDVVLGDREAVTYRLRIQGPRNKVEAVAEAKRLVKWMMESSRYGFFVQNPPDSTVLFHSLTWNTQLIYTMDVEEVDLEKEAQEREEFKYGRDKKKKGKKRKSMPKD